jgi:hypothetical protein
MEVRADLSDISNTVRHLTEIRDYCGAAYLQFESLLKGKDDKGNSLEDKLKKLSCRKLAQIVEELYKRGSTSAEMLCYVCNLINRVEDSPDLHEYVEILHACQFWIERDMKLLSQCEDAIEKKTYDINYNNIEEMISLHGTLLKLLLKLDVDIHAIQASERYIIEQAESSKAWVTVTKAAKMMGVSVGHTSRLVNERKIIGNGQKGKSRRVSKISVLEYKRKKLERDQLRDAQEYQKDYEERSR